MISENKVKLNEEALFKAMAYIDDDILEKLEQNPKNNKFKSKNLTSLIVIAASLFIVFGVILYTGSLIDPDDPNFYGGATSNQYSETTSAAKSPYSDYVTFKRFYKWTPMLNFVDTPEETEDNNIYYEKKLDSEELYALRPDKVYETMSLTGKAYFNSDNELKKVILSSHFVNNSSSFRNHSGDVKVTISKDNILKNYATENDKKISLCNGISYTIYTYTSGPYTVFEAEAIINGLYYNFNVQCTYKNQPYARQILELTIESFSSSKNAPNLNRIIPEDILE